jgi:soluble lytic murein transglycosylase-like protein
MNVSKLVLTSLFLSITVDAAAQSNDPAEAMRLILLQVASRDDDDTLLVKPALSMNEDAVKQLPPAEQAVVYYLKGIRSRETITVRQLYFDKALKTCPKATPLCGRIEIERLRILLDQKQSRVVLQNLRKATQQKLMSAEWRPEQFSLMLDALIAIKSDDLIRRTFREMIYRTKAGTRDLSSIKKVATYFESKKLWSDFENCAEYLVNEYPYTEYGRWAFTHIVKSQQGAHKDREPFYSLSFLQSVAPATTIDSGLKDFVLSALRGLVRVGSGEYKYLETTEQIAFLLQARMYKDALRLAEDELQNFDEVVSSERRVKRARLLFLKGQVESRLNEYRLAARTFSIYVAEFSDLGDPALAREMLADNLARLRQHNEAALIYGELGASQSADPVVRWNHFWNTYLSSNYRAALLLLDRPGYVPIRDKGIDGGLDYWRAKILEKLGNRSEADIIYKRLLTKWGDGFYSLAIQDRLPQLVKEHDVFSRALSQASPLVSSAEEEKPTSREEEIEFVPQLVLEQATYLTKWGERELSRRVTRAVDWSKVIGNPNETELIDTAYRMRDFTVGFRLVNLKPIFRSLPNDISAWAKYIKQNAVDFRRIYPEAYGDFLRIAANGAKVEPHLLLSLMRAESVFDPYARSSVGARGLLQIMPYTAVRISRVVGDYMMRIDKMSQPEVNIAYSALYTRRLLDYYGDNMVLAIASYNAGPYVVDKWSEAYKNLPMDEFIETIPFKETRRYVKNVLRNLMYYRNLYSTPASPIKFMPIPEQPANLEVF